jgi:excisionase family DNA binding protein
MVVGRLCAGMPQTGYGERLALVSIIVLFFTAEVADLLHVSPKTVSRWAKEGKLPFLKTLGGHPPLSRSRDPGAG